MSATENLKSYNKKCLKELQEPLKAFNNKPDDDVSDSDQVNEIEDDIDSDMEDSRNSIIESFHPNSKISGKKNDTSNIISTLLFQRELDLNKLTKLTKKYFKVQMLTEREETKNHYMKLELNTATISLDETNKQLKQQKEILQKTSNTFLICKIILFISVVFNLLCLS